MWLNSKYSGFGKAGLWKTKGLLEIYLTRGKFIE
jgi:hypothetical protein